MEFWVYKNADTPDDYDVWAAKGSNNNNTKEFALEFKENHFYQSYQSPFLKDLFEVYCYPSILEILHVLWRVTREKAKRVLQDIVFSFYFAI